MGGAALALAKVLADGLRECGGNSAGLARARELGATEVDVVIDGSARAMNAGDGPGADPLGHNAIRYGWSGTLPVGDHTIEFQALDHGSRVATIDGGHVDISTASGGGTGDPKTPGSTPAPKTPEPTASPKPTPSPTSGGKTPSGAKVPLGDTGGGTGTTGGTSGSATGGGTTGGGSTGGGATMVDPRDQHGMTALTRVFQVDLGLAAPVLKAGFGGRAYVRFDHEWEPLGAQLWRRARQLLLSRVEI